MKDDELDGWLRAWMQQGGWGERWFGLLQTFARDLNTAIVNPPTAVTVQTDRPYHSDYAESIQEAERQTASRRQLQAQVTSLTAQLTTRTPTGI